MPATTQTVLLAPSKRVVINMGETLPTWKYIPADPANAQTPGFDDTLPVNDAGVTKNWISVGLPYSAEQKNMFTNETSGGGAGDLSGSTEWYRKHFAMDAQYAKSKVMVEFEGAHTGVQVYTNGVFLPGTSVLYPPQPMLSAFCPSSSI